MSGRRAQGYTVNDWAGLFDPAFMERTRWALRDAIGAAAEGIDCSAAAHVLAEQLLRPLQAYLAVHWRPDPIRIDAERAERLQGLVQDLADRFRERWPFEPADATHLVDELLVAWNAFRAEASAHHVYITGPRLAQGRPAAVFTNEVGQVLSVDLLRSRVQAMGRRQPQKTVAAEFGCSVAHVSGLYKQADPKP